MPWIVIEYRKAGATEWSSNGYTPEQGFGDGCYDVYDHYEDVDHESTAYDEWEKAARAIAPTLKQGEVRRFTVGGTEWELRLHDADAEDTSVPLTCDAPNDGSSLATLQQAGYVYEHPGYWGKNIGAYCVTISDGVGINGMSYEVQIMTADGSACVYSTAHGFTTAAESIAHIEAWIASQGRVAELERALRGLLDAVTVARPLFAQDARECTEARKVLEG